ncbi:beta strand repeat-containing protein [Allochromatium tepidum]|uniref:DUF4214 domain-containing protein n=1 Tax=Allochromatium tepidum TaxID=553982 RepID=A0ABN6GEU2_9GAMM|nr:hypothetical protein [Allochromatium tepidum]BCU07997.1 hypothetical protein Atep_26740 [Allochromatium tepidum]
MATAEQYQAKVSAYFFATLGRPASSAELAGYTKVLADNNGSVWKPAGASLVSYLTPLLEAATAGQSNGKIVTDMFVRLVGSQPPLILFNYYTSMLDQGTIKLKGLANAMLNDLKLMPNVDGEFSQPSNWPIHLDDQLAAGQREAMIAKTGVAVAFTAKLDTPQENNAFIKNPSPAIQLLAGVTDEASAGVAKGQIDDVIADIVSGGGSPGQTFTLTTGIDNIAGTSGNDTIIGDNTGSADTMTAGDQVKGGDGVDTLKAYVKAATAIEDVVLPQLSNVENLYIKGGKFTAGNSVDYSGKAGVTSIELSDVAAMGTAGNKYTIKTSATQSVTLTNYNSSATNTIEVDGATQVNLNGVGTDKTNNAAITVDFISATATTATLAGTGAASKVTLGNTGAALTALTIKGDKDLTITESLNGLKTINASAATGKVSVNASGATLDAAFAFTGGSGNDTLTLKAGALGLITAGSQLDGGTGTDTLVTNESAVLTAAQIAKVNATKGFEVLGFGTSGSGVDVSQLTSINQFKVGAGNLTETFTNANSASKFTIDNSSSNTGTISIANKVGEGTTTITLDTGSATTAQTLATLTLTGITTVNLTSTGSAGNVVTTLNNADNSAITVNGSADLTLTLKATAIGSKIDGSAATGKLTLTGNTTAYSAGSSLGDILIGGSGDDTLKASVNNATLTGNGGNDNFDVSVALGGTASLTTITDFSKGDLITFANKGTEVFTATKLDVSAATTLAGALDLAAAGNGGTDAIVKWFQFGGNTYVVNDQTAGATFAATDFAVKLVGLVDLSTATFDTTANTLNFQ